MLQGVGGGYEFRWDSLRMWWGWCCKLNFTYVLTGGLNTEEDEDVQMRKRRRSTSTESMFSPTGTAVPQVTYTTTMSTTPSISPKKITISKSPQTQPRVVASGSQTQKVVWEIAGLTEDFWKSRWKELSVRQLSNLNKHVACLQKSTVWFRKRYCFLG